MDDQEKYFGRNKFMTPVIFESSDCNPGEIVNVKIKSFNKNNIFGSHKVTEFRAA